MNGSGKINFKYYDYKKNLVEEVISKKAEIYLFENYSDLKEAVKSYQPPPLSLQSKFITLKEFKEKIFSSDQIVIKEEKLPLILYSTLNKTEKRELRLDNYQDIYQFSAQFFAYFNLLQDYQISQLTGLAAWQQQRIESLKNIKIRYQNKLKNLNLIDRLTLKEEKNLNLHFLKEYQKINLFNISHFNPYFKDLLTEISSQIEIEFHLQLQKEDFSEKKLKLKKLTLPKKENKIKIKKSSSQLKSTAALLNEKENSKKRVQLIEAGPRIETAPILSDEFNFNTCQSLSETSIYQLLNDLYQLYQNGKNNGKILIELKGLYDLSTQKLFKKWLNLDADKLKQIKEFVRDDYYYLDRKIIKRELPVLNPLLNFLQNLGRIKTISELITFINKRFDFIFEQLNKETAEKFNDSLLELKSIEEMGIVENWKSYYSDQAAGLFSLLLNHLAFKSISIAENKKAVDFYTLSTAPQIKREKLLLNNVTQDNLSSGKGGLYFLSEKQLQENGLDLRQQAQLQKKYKLLRHLLNAEESIIFTVENESENISPAAILEELVLEYQLDFSAAAVNNLSERQILNNLFNYKSKKELKTVASRAFNQNLKVEKRDFGSDFNFSYYKYNCLKDCHHRFYLEHLLQLETALEIKPSLSLMTLGILTHQIFADLMIYARNQKLKPKEISSLKKKEIINQILQTNKLKIDKEYLNYYQQIIFKNLEASYNRFANLIEKYLPKNYKNILVEWPEWSFQREKYFTENEINFYLSGRIDLLLLNEIKDEYFLIDFKTGSGDKKQLDFYSLMLRQNYPERLAAESRKAIYNIFEQSFEHSYNKKEKEDQLGAEIKELTSYLFAGKEYARIYKSRCHNCPYHEICRVEVKNNEKSN